MTFHDRPIGIFDSGVGGLTVLRALRERLPAESLLYLGDTARLPYGTKSPETIARYAVQAAGLLVERGILVKVNSVLIPGVNDEHLKEVSRIVKAKGAFLHNVMPLIAEAVALADRILVMHMGRARGIRPAAAATQEPLLQLAMS